MTIADLPTPSGRRLARAPLELVVWQLVFAQPPGAVADAEVGPRLAAFLAADSGGEFTVASQMGMTMSVALGPAAPPQAAAQAQRMVGWQLRREQVVVTLNEQALSVETTDYTDWESFAEVLTRAVESVRELVEVPAEQRLGLRYVDKVGLEEVERTCDWSGYVEDWLRGPLAHPQLGEVVLAYAQQADFDAGDGMRATVRQRTFPDPERRGKPTMLLDFDAFREGYRLFDAGGVLEASNRLHDISHRLFRAAVSDRLYDMFDGDEVRS
jgi:uncharacterized protein (TIGR04255 family)